MSKKVVDSKDVGVVDVTDGVHLEKLLLDNHMDHPHILNVQLPVLWEQLQYLIALFHMLVPLSDYDMHEVVEVSYELWVELNLKYPLKFVVLVPFLESVDGINWNSC